MNCCLPLATEKRPLLSCACKKVSLRLGRFRNNIVCCCEDCQAIFTFFEGKGGKPHALPFRASYYEDNFDLLKGGEHLALMKLSNQPMASKNLYCKLCNTALMKCIDAYQGNVIAVDFQLVTPKRDDSTPVGRLCESEYPADKLGPLPEWPYETPTLEFHFVRNKDGTMKMTEEGPEVEPALMEIIGPIFGAPKEEPALGATTFGKLVADLKLEPLVLHT
mmetsp:Transcript_3133/g.8316  ORF Transcript_3133/g.8316 Transcript_3133/m.8316 type:complete len:220 (+) Transcript_3133:126-785(+)